MAKVNYLFPEKSNAVDLILPGESINKLLYKKALVQVE